jgi:hypothetical protein
MNAKLKFLQKLCTGANLWQHGSVMKTYYAVVILTAATLWSGCAFGPRGMVLEPVGPSPTPVAENNGEGSLVVYTAYEVNSIGIGDYEERRHYSDYKILTDDGKLLRTVHNDVGAIRQATHVALPAGKYRVLANANGYGTVTVPVVIGSNRLTVVHLEGGASWSDMAADSQASAVRLPDGEIVGWRAPAESARTP